MDKTLSIIDFDGMLYHSTRDTLEESIEALKDKLQNCLDKTNCTHWAGFVGKGKTFRNSISPDYKANRTGKPPKYLSALKEWAIAEYNLNVCIGYEADDAVGYFYSIPEFTRLVGHSEIECVSDEILNKDTVKILCSPDKDILKGFVGKHFDYTYRITAEAKERRKISPDYVYNEEDIIKGNWVESLPEDVDSFLKMQMIVGDAADGISGLKGKGIKYFENISKDRVVLFKIQLQDFIEKGKIVFSTKNLEETNYTYFIKNWISTQGLNMQLNRTSPSWYEILMEYVSHYKGNLGNAVYEFQKNFRLLYILRIPEDFIREVGRVPEYPNITEVSKEKVVEIKETF